MFKKIIASVLMLTLIITAFSGCTSKDLLKLFAIDPDEVDPATIMIADVINENQDQKVKVENPDKPFIDGDLSYTLYDNKTAALAGWSYAKDYEEDVKYEKGEEIPEAQKGEENPLKHKKGDPITKELVIPENVNVNGTNYKVIGIENKALLRNKYLGSLVISDSVEYIGNYAVMYCHNLETLTIGKNVKNIGYCAFQAEKKKPYESYSKLKSINWLGAPEVIGEKSFYFLDELTEIVLPEGIKEIGPWAFAKCVKAEKIILPEGLKTIGDHAFHKCIAATEVNFPGSCENVDVSTFYQCKELQKLTIGDGVKTLSKGAFEECSKLETVELPESLTDIGKYAFYNCTALKEIKYSKDATVNEDAFDEVPNLKEIKY